MDEKELSIKEAANQFIEALSKNAKFDKEHDTAKIVFYKKGKLHETIAYKHDLDFNNLEFICRKEKDIGDFFALLKSNNIIYNCKVIDYDEDKKAYVFLMKTETENVISE